MELLENASRHDAGIFEDDYDGEFRYDGKPLAALRSLDDHNRVIYVGTFSQAVSPPIRLGYLIMPPQLRRDLIPAQRLYDFSSPGVEQAALAQFIANGGLQPPLRRGPLVLTTRRPVLTDRTQAGLVRNDGVRLS